jgi:uncharacterized membrane protein YidH (DUF202 family)
VVAHSGQHSDILQESNPMIDTEAPQSLPDGALAMAIGEVQLILAEKRTSLALLRTGIAVIALPLSVLSLLIATSRYYDPSQVLLMLIGLLGICAVLTLFGGFLVIRATMHIHSYDRKLGAIKARYRQIAPFVE